MLTAFAKRTAVIGIKNGKGDVIMKTQKTIGTVKMFRIPWGVLMFVTVLLVAQQAGATLIFEDNFDSSTLAPEWLISPGKGS